MFYKPGPKVIQVSYPSLKDASFNFGLSTGETEYQGKIFKVMARYCYNNDDPKLILICKLN